MMPNVLAEQMISPACASGIQPAGSRARRISAASARWRIAGNIPCMAQVVAPTKAGVNASESPQGGNAGLDGKAAIDDEILPRGEAGVVAREPQHNAGDLLGGSDPAHRLAGGEGL